jgi:integrase
VKKKEVNSWVYMPEGQDLPAGGPRPCDPSRLGWALGLGYLQCDPPAPLEFDQPAELPGPAPEPPRKRGGRKAKGSGRHGKVQRRGKGNTLTWWARITYFDETGKRREKRRHAETKSAAGELVRKLLNDAEKTDGRSLTQGERTFDQLADFYESNYLIEIETANGKKIRGMRPKSLHSAKLQLRMLRQEFDGRPPDLPCQACDGGKGKGDKDRAKKNRAKKECKACGGKGSVRGAWDHSKRLASITYGDLKAFQAKRFKTKTKARRCEACDGGKGKGKKDRAKEECKPCGGKGSVKGERTYATVNRELTMLNHMLNLARQNGWIVENPFRRGPALVKLSMETKRTTTLDRDDEIKLLAAIDTTTLEGKRLRVILICAVASGMRQGELFQLLWSDVDLPGGEITLRADTTKTLTARVVPISGRMRTELLAWRQAFGSDDPRVFGSTANVERCYGRARRAAGGKCTLGRGCTLSRCLRHTRFHDLRHTAATRMIQGGYPFPEVGRIVGHSALKGLEMTYRYINADDSTIARAVAVIDAGDAAAAATHPETAVN